MLFLKKNVFLRRLIIFILSLLPISFLVWKAVQEELGTDPQKAIVIFTGTWTFYFLLITLTVTPVKKILGIGWLMVHRRMLGLFTLFYASLHVLAFYAFILEFNLGQFFSELVKRPYILLTIPAVILLIVLGVTSNQFMMRKLGKNWVKLHKSIYLIAILAWVHVLLQVRSTYYKAVLFGVLVFILLALRVYWRKKSAKPI